MVHGYHGVWGTYGFWLPNDPRGSWSEFVASWELARFGKASKTLERIEVDMQQWARWRAEAQQALKYPSVVLNGMQAQSVGAGFANGVQKSGFAIWACSILPEHIHLVIARHSDEIEQISNLLKGEATKEINDKVIRNRSSAHDEFRSGSAPAMGGDGLAQVLDHVALLET